MAKKKISNNLLSILLGFAILTSIVGILASMNILSPLTGAATQQNATVNLTVIGVSSCILSDSNINFSVPLVRLSSNKSDDPAVNDYHALENDGNTNLSITAWGATDLWGTTNNDNKWMIRCNNTQSGVCTSTYANVPNIVGSAVTVLDGLESEDTIDLVYLGVNVTVPNDEPSGIKGGFITYICTEI
ncbi:MAG: hypothetical protein KKH88_01675 [Nanoarchaeota archaeon]|nr:hypothetical protein [Nanoarchaeota archaeon]